MTAVTTTATVTATAKVRKADKLWLAAGIGEDKNGVLQVRTGTNWAKRQESLVVDGGYKRAVMMQFKSEMHLNDIRKLLVDAEEMQREYPKSYARILEQFTADEIAKACANTASTRTSSAKVDAVYEY